MLGKKISRNVPISMREGGGEIKLRMSLFKMSLFMVGGEGPIEKGPMSLSLLFFFGGRPLLSMTYSHTPNLEMLSHI